MGLHFFAFRTRVAHEFRLDSGNLLWAPSGRSESASRLGLRISTVLLGAALRKGSTTTLICRRASRVPLCLQFLAARRARRTLRVPWLLRMAAAVIGKAAGVSID